MSFKAASDHSDWVECPKGGIKVNSTTGHIYNLKTNTQIRAYRNRLKGNVEGVLPKNDGIDGLGRGRLHQYGRIVLAVLNGGGPSGNPRQHMALHKDGNPWNVQPSNLEWISKKEFMERLVICSHVGQKLNGPQVLTLKDVVKRVNSKDYHAIGSVFGISGTQAYRINTGRQWGYIDEYIKKVTEHMVKIHIPKVEEAIELFADYDKGLAKYLTSYGDASTVN